jgi:hypothetical protein
MQKILDEIERLLTRGKLEWHRDLSVEQAQPEGSNHDPLGYVGTSGGWRIAVCSFLVEDQGYPPGTRGYAGAASNIQKSLMIRLPMLLAKKLVEQAAREIN